MGEGISTLGEGIGTRDCSYASAKLSKGVPADPLSHRMGEGQGEGSFSDLPKIFVGPHSFPQ